MRGLPGDVRYAFATLRRAPAFSATAVATFALGIAATTAVFSILNGVLLRPLPYPDSQRQMCSTAVTARGPEAPQSDAY
jgi:hypothetical protein